MSERIVVLASASPARLGLLRAAGVNPSVRVSDVDEDAVIAASQAQRDVGNSLSPSEHAVTLAEAKAQAVADRILREEPAMTEALVIGADSVLEWDSRIWGKPPSDASAIERWQAMRGTVGVLHTGHCLIDVATGARADAAAATTLWFADVTDREITAYVSTGEAVNVAGGFTLDGLGAPFVESIEGDPSNVIGLSLPLCRHLTRQLGIEWVDLWDLPARDV